MHLQERILVSVFVFGYEHEVSAADIWIEGKNGRGMFRWL